MKRFESLVFITGLSGAGKSYVQSSLEDLGFYCVDNLPITMVREFIRQMADEGFSRIGIVVDVRTHDFSDEFLTLYEQVRKDHPESTLMFLEAEDRVLARRYSETRRPHPIHDMPVPEAIRLERAMLEDVRSEADLVLDTSVFSVHELKAFIVDRFELRGFDKGMLTTIRSFGFKYSTPQNLDLLFDVRFLPNPYFEEQLSEKTGLDQEVLEFLEGTEEYNRAVEKFGDLLDYLVPQYKKEMKSYLSIGIGCTGGRHRSVALAEALGKRLRDAGVNVELIHRDVTRADKKKKGDSSESSDETASATPTVA